MAIYGPIASQLCYVSPNYGLAAIPTNIHAVLVTGTLAAIPTNINAVAI